MRRALAPALLAVLFMALARTAALADCDDAVAPGTVFFVTDREPLPGAPFFSGERGKTAARETIVTYGVTGAPVTETNLHICSTRAAFFNAIRKRFPAASPRRAMIYIHGYYRTFTQAAETAALLQKSLAFPGPVIFYSWPSKVTSRLTYVNDESNSRWALSHFVDFLSQFEGAFSGTTISFVSHSMGGRFASAGFEFMRHSVCPKCVGRSIFYAPDEDSDTLYGEFERSGLCSTQPVAKAAAGSAALVTLYVSNRDTALRDSQELHGHQRAGEAGSEIILCNGVDTIDVSYVKGGDSAGHTYQVYPEVLADSRQAFAGVSPGSPLRKLTPAQRPNGAYYELRP